MALDYFYAGAPAQAIDVLTKAIQLDPRNVSGRILLNMGGAQFMAGYDDAAIQWLLKSIDASPHFPQSRPYLAMAYARKGDLIRARAATADMLRARPISRLDNFEVPALDHPDAYLAFWDNELVPAARLAGIPGSTPSETDLFVALRHLYAGAPARAIELFNQGLRADPQHVPRFALVEQRCRAAHDWRQRRGDRIAAKSCGRKSRHTRFTRLSRDGLCTKRGPREDADALLAIRFERNQSSVFQSSTTCLPLTPGRPTV